MFLATQAGEFLIIAIIGVIIIAVALLIYFIVTNKAKKEKIEISPNFETKSFQNVQSSQPLVTEVPQNTIQETHVESFNPNPISNEDVARREAEDEKTDSNIQTLLNQMQADLDKNANQNYQDSINRYEDDEEANAIISYKELMKYKENKDKEIVLEDKDKEEIKEIIKEEVIEEPKEEVKKFKRSEFISPIFGYNDETNVTYREIKRPPRKEIKVPVSENEWESDRMLKELEDSSAEVMDFNDSKIKKEVSDTKNDDFLDALVDFRKKLD